MAPPELRRYRLTVHYDGASFHGWQRQGAERTVQGEMERIAQKLTGSLCPVLGSGRTDRGVHARGQVASVSVPERWTAAGLRSSMNALLPPEIWVAEVQRVLDDFHPRYHAASRSYQYQLGTEPEAASPFFRGWCWDVSRNPPDPAQLARCAQLIPGERSFRRFARTGQPERGERCRVTEAVWTDWAGPGIRFQISADRFLHHMVRYLVGTMMEVAMGRRPLEEMAELLARPDSRLVTSPPAPPEGLFLTRVEYPPERLGAYPDRDPPERNDTHS